MQEKTKTLGTERCENIDTLFTNKIIICITNIIIIIIITIIIKYADSLICLGVNNNPYPEPN